MASARSSNKSPHLSFTLMKDHWFKELYQGLKVAARTESFIKTIEGQVRCITAEFKPNWCQCSVECQLQCVHPSLDGPASVPKCRNSRTVMGSNPCAQLGLKMPKLLAEPMHGLRLIIKEEAWKKLPSEAS